MFVSDFTSVFLFIYLSGLVVMGWGGCFQRPLHANWRTLLSHLAPVCCITLSSSDKQLQNVEMREKNNNSHSFVLFLFFFFLFFFFTVAKLFSYWLNRSAVPQVLCILVLKMIQISSVRCCYDVSLSFLFCASSPKMILSHVVKLI